VHRLDVGICSGVVEAGAALSALFTALLFTAGRFVVVNEVFVTEAASTDDDDCTASPLHFNACSLDFYHTHTGQHT